MEPGKVNLRIIQGATFRKSVRWGQPSIAAVAISVIAGTAPAVITTSGAHGLPSITWPVRVVGGRHGIGSDPVMATNTGASSLTVPVSTITAAAFKGPAELQFNPPVDLTGFTARMQVRSSQSSAAVLLELTTANGGIALDPEGLVTIILTDEQTAGTTWISAVYDLELISAGGEVTRLIEGEVSVSKEVTREASP